MIVLLSACDGSEHSPLYSDTEESADSLEVEIKWGDTTELDLIDALFSEEVDQQRLLGFLDSGGDFNKFAEYTHNYEYDRLGSHIPIVKDFIHEKTVSGSDSYTLSPLQALIINKQPEKLDLLSFMLQHGADPNVKSPEGMNALEYYYNTMRSNLLISQWEVEGNFMAGEDEAYTLKIIDTLVAHGADIKNSSLAFAGGNTDVMEHAIALGADSKTINVVNFFGGPGILADRDKIKKLSRHGFDLTNLEGYSVCFFVFDDDEVQFLFECGFDPNTPIMDGYILDHAIKEDKLFLVKCIVEHGGSKVSHNQGAVKYAQENDASKEIIEYLKSTLH